jgi:hypothetical protein
MDAPDLHPLSKDGTLLVRVPDSYREYDLKRGKMIKKIKAIHLRDGSEFSMCLSLFYGNEFPEPISLWHSSCLKNFPHRLAVLPVQYIPARMSKERLF